LCNTRSSAMLHIILRYFKLKKQLLIYTYVYAVLSLDPLIGAISAGNVVVIKPSEQAPACSEFLANTIPQYLDSNAIKVIEGGSTVCEQLLQQKWDKIFFTGIFSIPTLYLENFLSEIILDYFIYLCQVYIFDTWE